MSNKNKKAAKAAKLAKDSLACNKPKRTPSHPTKSHVVKAVKRVRKRLYVLDNKALKVLVKIQKQKRTKHVNVLTMHDIMPKIQIQVRCLPDIGHIK